MKLLPNFYQVAGHSVSLDIDATAFLLKTKEGCFLLDCGTDKGYGQILNNIRETGTDPRDIKAIFATHGHYDHIAAASCFKRDFGTELYIHEADADIVRTGDNTATSAALLYGSDFPPCEPDGLLRGGETYDFAETRMEVMHTPGHTPGGCCFVLTLCGLTLLVAGDTLWGGFHRGIGSSEEMWRESLNNLTSRHFDLLVFGHHTPQLFGDAVGRLKSAEKSFANYYTPWFKTFKESYKY